MIYRASPLGLPLPELLDTSGAPAVCAFKRGVRYSTHRQLVLHYSLWYHMSVTIWLSRVCESHPDREPLQAREFRHYLEAIGA